MTPEPRESEQGEERLYVFRCPKCGMWDDHTYALDEHRAGLLQAPRCVIRGDEMELTEVVPLSQLEAEKGERDVNLGNPNSGTWKRLAQGQGEITKQEREWAERAERNFAVLRAAIEEHQKAKRGTWSMTGQDAIDAARGRDAEADTKLYAALDRMATGTEKQYPRLREAVNATVAWLRDCMEAEGLSRPSRVEFRIAADRLEAAISATGTEEGS